MDWTFATLVGIQTVILLALKITIVLLVSSKTNNKLSI